MMTWERLVPFVVGVSISVGCAGQTAAPAPNQAKEIEQLRSSLTATRSELQACRQEIEDLKAQVSAIHVLHAFLTSGTQSDLQRFEHEECNAGAYTSLAATPRRQRR